MAASNVSHNLTFFKLLQNPVQHGALNTKMSFKTSPSRDFNELELMMTCLAEDSQWLDSFQAKSLLSVSCAQSQISTEARPDTLSRRHIFQMRTTCQSNGLFSSQIPAVSDVVDSEGLLKDSADNCDSLIPTAGRDSPPGNKRKHSSLSSLLHDYNENDHSIDDKPQSVCNSSRALTSSDLNTVLSPTVLSEAVANDLPAPEFIKRGRSSVASETYRLVRSAGFTIDTFASRQPASRASVEEMD